MVQYETDRTAQIKLFGESEYGIYSMCVCVCACVKNTVFDVFYIPFGFWAFGPITIFFLQAVMALA